MLKQHYNIMKEVSKLILYDNDIRPLLFPQNRPHILNVRDIPGH